MNLINFFNICLQLFLWIENFLSLMNYKLLDSYDIWIFL